MVKDVKKAAAGEPQDDEDIIEEGESLALDALDDIASEAPLDLTTLVADLRDANLELFKHRPKPWGQMTEAEQRSTARLVEAATRATIARAVLLLAADERPAIEGRLEKFASKGGKFQITLIAVGGPELAADLARLDGHHVVIASADADPYSRERPAAIQPDQEPLEFEEEPPAPHDPDTGELFEGSADDELADEAETATAD